MSASNLAYGEDATGDPAPPSPPNKSHRYPQSGSYNTFDKNDEQKANSAPSPVKGFKYA